MRVNSLDLVPPAISKLMRRPRLLLLAVMLCGPNLVAGDDFEAALAKAEQGDVAAQFNVGQMYSQGKGVSANATEAVKWWRKAAEQGDADAQCNVGTAYGSGESVQKDQTEAVKWYRKAAEQGHAAGQYNLGNAYAKGLGVLRDLGTAVQWYRDAAKHGDSLSAFYQRILGATYANGGQGLQKDTREAMKWFRLAAEQGDAFSQYNLGVAHNIGDGTPKDEIEALAWFNIGAAGGYKSAVTARNATERRLGREATLVAQQRSKEIQQAIEAREKEQAQTESPGPSKEGTKKETSTGTGTIISESGYVLTAAHVITGATAIKVVTTFGRKTAVVVSIDKVNDIALLKMGSGPYHAVVIGSSRSVRLGQAVATIGFPNIGIQGFSPKVTRGEISSLNGIADDPRAWQISVPIQPGNSGGPLLDNRGTLVGVVVAKLGIKASKLTGEVPQNVGYAVKSDYTLPLLEPYVNSLSSKSAKDGSTPTFEDMVSKAQQSVVLIIVN